MASWPDAKCRGRPIASSAPGSFSDNTTAVAGLAGSAVSLQGVRLLAARPARADADCMPGWRFIYFSLGNLRRCIDALP